MKARVLLIGGNSLPNFVVLNYYWDRMKENDLVYPIHSNDTKSMADDITDAIDETGKHPRGTINLVSIIDRESNPSSLREKG